MIEVTATAPSGGGGSGNAAVNENFVQSQKKFSVGTGMQVYFSQGNLQYQASTDTWRFAEHQYEVVPEEKVAFALTGYGDEAVLSDTNIGPDYEEWIDVFGWGSSGYGRAKPYTRNFWEKDSSGKTISRSLEIYGAIGVYIDYDWGVYNPIANGGNNKGLWYTLTADQWAYLLSNRSNANTLRAPATIKESAASSAKSVVGLVVLPDDWTTASVPDGITFTTTVSGSGDAGWATNVFTYDEWEKMESAGAVFLPALGYQYRDGVYSYRSSNIKLFYWSSTCPSAGEPKQCIECDGPSDNPYAYSMNNAYYYLPVRLVKSATEIAANIYVSPSGSSSGDGSEANPYESIASAITKIKNNNSRTTDYTIFIDRDLTAKQTISNINPNYAKSITIKGKNGINSATGEPNDSITGSGAASSGPLLTIQSNVPISVEDLKITGGYASMGGGVYVGNGDACYVTLGSGALITGNKADTRGGGVYAYNYSNLTIDGATISANELLTADSNKRKGSGVCFLGNDLVIKGESKITGNLGSTTDNNCPAVYSECLLDSYNARRYAPTITIDGDTQISNNIGVGLQAQSCNTTIKGNTKIFKNKNMASSGGGGGLYVYSTYFGSPSSNYASNVTISGNVQIYENEALFGAGIYAVYSYTTLNIEGGSINGNIAQTCGGGLYCDGSTVNMSGGQITGNTVVAETEVAHGGGGVYIKSRDENNAFFVLTGGSIKSNTCSSGRGTGVFVHNYRNIYDSNPAQFKMGGAAKVDTSNDVYLMRVDGSYDKPTIAIETALTQTGTLATITLGAYVANDPVLSGIEAKTYYTRFTLSDTGWHIEADGTLASN